ncbi:HpcH/HpaI aldolase family protein [Celeribacter neptunius]|uniref:2-keto-3-deoxy-L-rhamnonate aldolase RhmA n=1 Tax=Celeribacter neptunius TaxID=588602 RepID=A0A1I3TAK8_9RHOB|nr:aldolase/citrate lyase family protein [Celeribacter neptunius]SFJ67593.1 2-keto-3-deoxy-L-rhamnonate aldolase RhmA [Celeribacter neptunius]
MAQDLRARIKAKELLIGTFIKTPAPQNVEILGQAGLDFAVVDQEHAPIGIEQMDRMALASRAAGLPLLSRRWGATRDWIAPLLDLGMAGVMVPHVMDGADAETVCDAVRFARGKRGLSPSPRAGNYGGMGGPEYREVCDASGVVMVQIEDASALDHLDEISAIEDVDMMFVGPADLSQSMQVGYPSPELDDAIMRIVAAGQKADTPIGLFVGNARQIPDWHARGVTLFVCGSDQSMLRSAATRLAAIERS